MTSDSLPPLGYLELECNIPRPLGDACNEQTWPFPLIRQQIRESQVDQVVTNDSYPAAFIDRVVEAGQKLAEKGCIGLITDCGFLAKAQNELSSRLPIPIAASSLIELPSILAILPLNKSVGVVTYDESVLGPAHLSPLGITNHDRVHIIGAPRDGELRKMVEQEGTPYNFSGIEAEVIQCTKTLIQSHPEIGAILLECTQMPPFAVSVQKAVGLPVYDIYTMATWFYSGLVTRRPESWGQEVTRPN